MDTTGVIYSIDGCTCRVIGGVNRVASSFGSTPVKFVYFYAPFLGRSGLSLCANDNYLIKRARVIVSKMVHFKTKKMIQVERKKLK